MKRFYDDVAVLAEEVGFAVRLDGKPLRTPAKAPLVLPSRALAEAVAAEWRGQGVTVKLTELPLTRLASTGIDLVSSRRGEIAVEVARYAGTDLVCYRAEHPPELARRQHVTWQPLIDWATLRYDAPLEVTAGIVPVTQSPSTLRAFALAVESYGHLELAALHLATSAAGSLVVALALLEGRLDVESAFAAAQLDENFEIEQWGEDAEQTERRAALMDDMALAYRFISLLRVADPLVRPSTGSG
ncbi:MAG TPA: ATP12 family protein [Stellaceae bacterium]|nr:ATP12 family protein [Stellaceae bacterium]